MLPGGTYRIIAFSLLFVPELALAQGPIAGIPDNVAGLIEVVVAGDAQVEADPGSALTVGFEVRNRHSRPVTITSHVDAPAGWSIIAPGDAFEIAPNGHALRLVGLRIPDGYGPGSYSVTFTAVSVDRQAEDHAELIIDVGTFNNLRIYVSDAPRLVSASKPHAIEFVVHNMGNTGVTAHLVVESTPFSAILDEEVITITANGRYPVSVQVEPDPNLTRQSKSRVRLRGQLVQDASVVADAEALVGVIPDGARAHSLRPRVELNARISSAGDRDSQGLQTEIVGRVPLSGDNLHEAEFTLRTPSTARTVLSQAETYALSYSGPRFWAKLGDHVFDVSPLTSVGRFGTGAGAGGKFGKIAARAHFQGHQHSITADREGGASVVLDLGEWGRYSVNALAGSGFNEGYAGSLRYELSTSDALSFDMEGGLSGREHVEPIFSIGVRGRLKETGYHLRAIHRGAEHPGKLSSYSSQLLGVSSRVREGLSVSMTVSNEASVSPDAGLPTRYRRFVSGAITGQSRHQDLIATGRIELRGEALEYSFDGSDIATRMSQLRLRGGIAVRRLRVSSSVEISRISSPTGREGVRSRVEVESSWSKDSHRIQASVVRESGPTLQLLQPSSYVSFRLGGEEQLTNQLKFRMNLMGSLIEMPANVATGTGWAGLEYQFPDGKRLTAEVQLVMRGDVYLSTQTTYRLTLDIPLSATNPIPMRGALLEGAVVDETTGEGIAEVLVLIGDQSTLTGADGRFVLRRPATGSYYLTVDRVTLGLDRVPSVSMPMLINVPAEGPVDFIRIPVSRRGELRGEVRLFDVRGGVGSIPTDTVDVGPAGQVVVEISSGSIRYRRASNADGSFSFTDLPPGTWSVRVVERSLPRGFDSEQRTYAVELPSSDPVSIRLLSVSRPNHFLNGGVLQGARSGVVLRPRRN